MLPPRWSSALTWRDTGSGIQRRHPDTSLEEFEELGHQRVEVKIFWRNEIEGQFVEIAR